MTKNIPYIAVASSGIAATLLINGTTAHSILSKIPINLRETSICSIRKNSDMAKIIKKCKFIIWDECTLTHKHALESVDRLLKDLMNTGKIIGGISILLSGDFQ